MGLVKNKYLSQFQNLLSNSACIYHTDFLMHKGGTWFSVRPFSGP